MDTKYTNSKGIKISTKCWKQVDYRKSIRCVFTEIKEAAGDLKAHVSKLVPIYPAPKPDQKSPIGPSSCLWGFLTKLCINSK